MCISYLCVCVLVCISLCISVYLCVFAAYVSVLMCVSVYYCGCVFVTSGNEDVGEDDQCRQEETGCLRDPPPQVTEHAQSQQFGGKINGSKDDLHQVDTHLEQQTANRRIQYEPANRMRGRVSTNWNKSST